MPSPYMTTRNDWGQYTPQAMMLAKMGKSLLESGQVTPQEAAANLKASGFSPYSPAEPTQERENARVNEVIGQGNARQAEANQQNVMAEMGNGVQAAAPNPTPPGSGAKDVSEAEERWKQITTSRDMTTLSPMQIALTGESIARLPEVQEWQKGQKEVEDQLAMEKSRPMPVNLQPIAALLDSWYGSNLASSMKPSETVADRRKRILEYAQKAQQDRKDIAHNVISGVMGSKAGYLDTIREAIGSNKNIRSNQDPSIAANKGRGNPVTQSHQFNTYAREMLKPNDKSAEEFGSIVSEVASANPIDDNRIAILRAKLDANGRPNISEVQMEAGDKSAWERARQTAERLMTGKLTDHNRELLLQSLQEIGELKDKERAMFVSKLKAQGKSQYQQNDRQLGDAFPTGYSQRFSPGVKQAKENRAKLKAPPGIKTDLNPAAQPLSREEWEKAHGGS